MTGEQGEAAGAQPQDQADVVIYHPAFGRLERRQVSGDGLVELYQDENNLILFFYNGLLRTIINPNFWQTAQCSFIQFPSYAQLQVAAQPVMNFPLETNILLEGEEEFPAYIDDGT